MAWFSLRVREVPGSIPGAAQFWGRMCLRKESSGTWWSTLQAPHCICLLLGNMQTLLCACFDVELVRYPYCLWIYLDCNTVIYFCCTLEVCIFNFVIDTPRKQRCKNALQASPIAPSPSAGGTKINQVKCWSVRKMPRPGIEPGTFRSSVWHSPNWAIAAC